MKPLYIQPVYHYAGDIMNLANQSIIKLASEILAEADKELLCSDFIENVVHRVVSLSSKWKASYDSAVVVQELHRRSGLIV